MSAHAPYDVPRPATPRALAVAAAMGGVVLVAGAVTAGAAVQTIALVLAVVAAALIVARPEWGVFVLTSTFFLSYPESFTGSGNFTINNIVGLVLAGVLIVRALITRRLDVFESPVLRALLLVWGALLLNRLVADASPPFASLARLDLTEVRATDFTSKLAFVVFVIAFVRARWQVALYGISVALFVVLTAPSAIVNALTAAPLKGNIEHMRAAADFGIMAARNANRLAFLCALAIAVIGCAMVRVPSRAFRVGGAMAITGLVTAVFLSASRSGMLSLLILAAFFLLRSGLPVRRLVAGGVAAVAIFAVVAAVIPGEQPRAAAGVPRTASVSAYVERITTLVSGDGPQGAEVSTQNRLDLTRTGLRMFVDHPVMGVGLGNFRWKSITDYGNRHVSALHNSYLLTLVEGGLVVFGAYLVLFVVVWKALAAAQRRAAERPGTDLGWLVTATRLMFVLFLVFSAFADCWHESYLPFLLGLTAVLARTYAAVPPAVPAPRAPVTA